MERISRLNAVNLSRRIKAARLEGALIDATLIELPDTLAPAPPDTTPMIQLFDPVEDYAGAAIVIEGKNFANDRAENQVSVGGKPAYVVESSPTRLLVITHSETRDASIKVIVAGEVGESKREFRVRPWPKSELRIDGPPFSFEGRSPSSLLPMMPSAGTVPPTGTANILVVNCHPTDLIPPDLAVAKQDVVDTFADVTTYFDQASYGQLTVQVDVTDHVPLLEDSAYYHKGGSDPGYPNIDLAIIDQLLAECASGAQGQGFNLNNYALMVVSVHLPGLTVRAWGGFERSNFAYDDGADVSINITTDHALALVAQSDSADWGRSAHEFAHSVLDPGMVLGEDVYGSDLVDASEATASAFEMMGNHDSHPLFSAHNMHQLGWYSSAKVQELQWDRNPFSAEFELVAHALSENGDPARHHLLRITVSPGLFYYVEVRQRPGATAQVFDENIPLPMGDIPDGGVVVTKVVTDALNNNHQTRLITLLQSESTILVTGDTATDPLRALRIEVVDDDVVSRPRICRVRVEWAQSISDDPAGQFDLRIEPWGAGYETEDIWIDRAPFGSFDFTDGGGNPIGNGDRPRPLEVNRYFARVHNDGAIDAEKVRVVHYAISPPGVGDNGTWTPIDTIEHALIPSNGSVQGFVPWVPLVGEHTCLKVAIEQQFGEVSGGNNQAQENVFEFEPPSASVPAPVKLTVAVRNPLKIETPILIHLENVPRGYRVYFPHRWLWLPPLGERKLDLLVIPTVDFKGDNVPPARVRLYGRVPRGYVEKLPMTGVPGSWFTPIGGVTANVRPKRRADIELDKDVKATDESVHVSGSVRPATADQQVRIEMTAPDGQRSTTTVFTDRAGRYRAVFKRTERKRQESEDGKECHEFEAEIISATRLAPAVSNQICVFL